MDLTMDTKLTVPEDILVQDMQGESVLLNLDNSYYYGLDKMGTRMWHTLSGSESIQKAYDDLLARYDVEAGVLRRDLFELVQKLMDNGLLKVADE
jgi:hypothetical protein